MKLVADSKGRLTCRKLFPAGVAFEAEKDPVTGQVTLVELVPKTPKPPAVKVVRRGNRTFLSSDRRVTREDVRKATEEFP